MTIPYGQQWLDQQDILGVKKILQSDWLTQGPTIQRFEQTIAKKTKTKYAIAVNSGTTALHLACLAAGIQSGDEVIVPTLTFAATANCVLCCNAIPVLCDIDLSILTLDPQEVEKKITSKTKAIIAVDFAGHPAHWDELKKIAKKHDLVLIADAAHSLNAKYKNEPIGSLADLTVFSFHPVKAITTGEGGMVVTNNKRYADKICLLRTHGINQDKKMIALGYNYRLTDIQAALGLSQLKKLTRFINRRRQIAKQYFQAFQNINEIILPPKHDYIKHAWHIFVLQFKTKNRDKIRQKLEKQGIGTQIHYRPIHLQPYYQKNFDYRKGNFPNTELYYSRCLTIPLFPKMTNKQVLKIISRINNL